MNKQYQEIQFSWGDLEDAVNELFEHKEKGQLVYGDFNGTTLYSDTVTMDDAYKEITGSTKAEFDKAQQEREERWKREESEHEERIPELITHFKLEGRKILAIDRWEFWDKVVPVRLRDLYRGSELSSCLEIVNVLNNGGDLEEAKEIIHNQNHSGMSFSIVCTMVKELCDRGKEFVEYIN